MLTIKILVTINSLEKKKNYSFKALVINIIIKLKWPPQNNEQQLLERLPMKYLYCG